MKNLLILMSVFFTISCQAEKENMDILSTLEAKLPSEWKVELTDFNQAPFQWEGKDFVGKKLKIYKPLEKENVDIPYSKKEETYSSQRQLVRYLYEKMNGGFRYKMMERVHPDQLEKVTAQYIIITPSSMSLEKDVSPGKEIYDLYREVLYKDVQEIERINSDFFSQPSFPDDLKGKKALIFDINEGMYTSFGIYAP